MNINLVSTYVIAEKDGNTTKYDVLDYHVIKQQNVKPYVYDENYIDTYNHLDCTSMSKLRYDNIVSVIGRKPNSILDVGYGNGNFLQYCYSQGVEELYGYDVSPQPTPEPAKRVDNLVIGNYDVITFFDSLEHMENADAVINSLAYCNYVCVSVPECRDALNFTLSWFNNWKHRKIDEHIWYFSKTSLIKFMNTFNYKLIAVNNVEDNIRKNANGEPNILTAIFEKSI